MEILIANKELEILDTLSNITIVNTSVYKNHKVERSSHGERKIYLPGNIEEKNRFFDNFLSEINGFVWRENLKDYLQKAKSEYYNPSQNYNNKAKMRTEYKQLLDKINKLNEILPFKVKKADVKHTGLYINQNSGKTTDKNWNLITDIALPNISRLSIIKGVMDGVIIYYFKLNYGASNFEELDKKTKLEIDKVINSKKSDIEKEAIIKARIGQGTYRKKLLQETSMCPFTFIDDENLLIASHIKPWKYANSEEKKILKMDLYCLQPSISCLTGAIYHLMMIRV